MNSRLFFYPMVLLLIVAGLLTAWLRHERMGIPFVPGVQTPIWLVEARVDFTAKGEPVTISLDLPENPPGFSLFDEQTASPGYGFAVLERGSDRRGEWSIRTARGPQVLYYKVQAVPLATAPAAVGEEAPAPPEAALWSAAESLAAQQLLETAYQQSSDPVSMTRALIQQLLAPVPDQNATLLLGQTLLPQLLQKLLHTAGIPARIAMGLQLEDGRRNQQLTPVLEIYHQQRWLPFDLRTGAQGLPQDFLLWHQGSRSLLDVQGAYNSRVRFSMLRQSLSAVQLAHTTTEESKLAFFGVHKLPVEEQNMLKTLLVLPLGVLVMVFMRVLVGLKTAGTFMPVLIALSFYQTALLPGLTGFLAIVALGLLLRGYLSALNLLLVARISTIVIIVIFIVLFLSLTGYQLGYNTGMTVTFFPVIIVAWTIERMSILWEDEGPREVLIQGGGSLLVAVFGYLLMTWPLMAHLSFHFPEINLIIVALILLMGHYTGYRLLELRRFRSMLPRS
ncbi:inactive transglutaminase family protein [Desulfuromonas thiophila]|uniref:inactive transglutaminase family protein n=1 Tax=Desulfuromonas thiophila TaxID=57664 RepID=UPI0024A83367|nr:inactive transglutaminase family protein [Desulfuromonas thiophila]